MIFIVISLLGSGFYTWYINANQKHDEVHVHAGFKVFVDDKPVDFSLDKYMYFLPCGLDEHEQTTVQDRVHLHDGVGDVVHVHAKGVRWQDLFESIKYKFPENVEIAYYINGEKVEDLLSQEIVNEESIIIVVDGKQAEQEYFKEQVSVERIEKIAHSKENCGE